MKVVVRQKPTPIVAASNYDVLFAVRKMQRICGSTDIVTNLWDSYFTTLLRVKEYEPFSTMGVSREVACTFYNLCKLLYLQNYNSAKPQTELCVPQEMWNDDYDSLRDSHLEILSDLNCISIYERNDIFQSVTGEMQSKVRIFTINQNVLSLIISFGEKICDKSNFPNGEQKREKFYLEKGEV